MRRAFFLLTTLLLLVFFGAALQPTPVAAGDGIPDNCENTVAAFYQANVFPRYEPQNGRLVLVDWTTGAEVRTLVENLPATRIQGWSPDCHYLTGAAYHTQNTENTDDDTFETIIWDTTTGATMGTVPDAHIQPHHITWGPEDYLVVETRSGAFLWNVRTGTRVLLTSSSDGSGQSFKTGVFDWDFANNQLHTWLSIPPYGGAIYDLTTGALVGISDHFGRAFSTDSSSATLAKAPESDALWCRPSNVSSVIYSWGDTYRGPAFKPGNIRAVYEAYNRRIVLTDATSRETIQVVDEGVETGEFTLLGFSPDCRFMGGGLRNARGRYDTVIWDLKADPVVRVQTAGGAIGYPYRVNWSPDSAYAVVSGRTTGYLGNLLSGESFRLTPRADEDCTQFPVGCVGSLFALGQVNWETPGQVRIGLVGGSQVSIDLATGEAVGYTAGEGYSNAPTYPYAQWYGYYRYNSCKSIVRYEPYSRRLAIREYNTGELLRVVEDHLELTGWEFEGWSPNCNYIVAAVGPRADSDTVIWNLATNRRVGVFENALKHPHYFIWTPDSGAIVIQSRNGAYLWNLATNERVLLTEAATDDGRNFLSFAWDTARGQLLAVTVGAPNVVSAYDYHSGQLMRTYSNGSSDAQVSFEVLNDGYRMTVWNTDENRQAQGFTLWNLNDGSSLKLTANQTGSPYLKFSDSGRFIASWNTVFWDTQNLAGGDFHPPTYVRDFGDSYGLKFESDSVVMTFMPHADIYDVARRRYHLTTYRWDLASGALLSESEETITYSGMGCCSIPSS